MSKRYRDWVRAHSDVRGSARAVLNILADYASDDGLAWPGYETLAKESGLSKRTVIRCIDNLIAQGAVEYLDGGLGRGHPARYRVLTAIKGDKKVTDSHLSAEEKVTTVPIKGDNVTGKGDNVTSPTYTRDLEPEEPEAEPRAEPLPPVPAKDPFFDVFEKTWGRLAASEYEAGKIADWSERVTLDGWAYALKESADARKMDWRYTEAILRRVEREGYQPRDAPPPQTTQVAYSLEELCLT